VTRYAVLTVWDDDAASVRGDHAPVARVWSGIAVSHGRFDLRPLHSRGRWSGREPFDPNGREHSGMVLALTRARLRPVKATVRVWRSHADLAEFAYRRPEHRTAVARTATGHWYAEELFARFAVLDVVGDRAVLGWPKGLRVPGGWRVGQGQGEGTGQE
jgi:hypothetical protein